MNFGKIKDHLENKEEKNTAEKICSAAFSDEEFKEEFKGPIKSKISQIPDQVLNNPGNFDNPENENHFKHYNALLSEIASLYSTYLVEKNGGYSRLNEQIDDVQKKIDDARLHIENIEQTSDSISEARVLAVYAKEFKKRAKRYNATAYRWKRGLYWSFGIFAFVFALLLMVPVVDFDYFTRYLSPELKKYGYFAIVIIKVLILLGFLQIIRFYFRNYNANKHLESEALHKYDVLRSLQGVHNTIDVSNKEKRDELIRAGALIAFQGSESGYITTKEGAGNVDAGIYSAIEKILNKS